MKKIIVKESQLTNVVENVVKEQLSDDPNAFSTEVQDVSFYGLEKYFPEYVGHDMDVSYTNCYVNWRYDMDIRSWGIKDISVYTSSVVINAMVEIYDEDYTKVEVEKEIELMVDDMGGFSSDEEGKWHYEDQMSDELFSQSVFPTGLEVDFNDKTVHVLWN
jgi:hypothetical protein|tara:strand:+ start:2794 stop:3276 length:483 start_codon:yes stop_codon:yes gene_type:complete